jgi:hypothetical protein
MEVDTAPPTDSPAAPAKTEQPGVLSDAQLEKMFKLTSMFVVPDGTGAVYDIGEDMFDDDAIDDLAADIDEYALQSPNRATNSWSLINATFSL